MDEAFTLFEDGQRLHLTLEERAAFMEAAKTAPRRDRTFATVLHDTGCRISEALPLSLRQIDLSGKRAVFESIKKRRGGVYRAVPLSEATLDTLDIVHGLSEAHRRKNETALNSRLWPMSRTSGWRVISRLMDEAGIDDGPHKSPKGLRHGFGVAAVLNGVPVTTLQKWMGHAKLETTQIYLNVIGAEERDIAARMWR